MSKKDQCKAIMAKLFGPATANLVDSMSEEEQKQMQKDVLVTIDKQIDLMLSDNPDGNYSKRAWYIDQLLEEVNKYEGNFNLYSSGSIVECLALEGRESRNQYLNRFTTASLRSMLQNLRYMMAMHEPIFLEEYSRRLSADQNMLRTMNPAVWDATTATLKYSAFFRYLKHKYPLEWDEFIIQLENIKIAPEVSIPTVMLPEGKF